MTTPPRPAPRGGPALLMLVLFAVAASYAISVDVPRAGYGVKSDEATYVAMALSAAYDGNLSFDRRDLIRFEGLYQSGPEGIFLKRGKQLRIHPSLAFPFVRTVKLPDPDPNRLYFGKALIYPLFAAPFVRILGLNGLLLFNVLLLAAVGILGYVFLAPRSSTLASLLITTGFLGASVLPVYGAFLMPEIFNVSVVFVAYFLWLYKEANPGAALAGRWTDLVAALLLGMATYSKPLPIGLLVAPLVGLAWLRRRWFWGVTIGALAVATAAALFCLTAAVSGEFNYQGGDRRTFYGTFPFDKSWTTWDQQGTFAVTEGDAIQDVLTSPEMPSRFVRNVGYFLAGRHFGFIPYFFPGVVAIVIWLLSSTRREPWRVLTFLTFVTSVVVLLLVLPFTWSGGGGPPGNRYLLSVYPTLFFLVSPIESAWPGVVSWFGGTLFTARMLVSPFVAAGFPWLATEHGPARLLPVELTMANDLPARLAPSRTLIPYGQDPVLRLYFLDQNAYPPEPTGLWVSATARADIVVRSVDPIDHLVVEAQSAVRTTVTLSMGRSAVIVKIEPGKVSTFEVPASGARGLRSYAYLLSARSSAGFVPHLDDPASRDYRNLGVQLRFQAVTTR
jgi:hypothetical protein